MSLYRLLLRSLRQRSIITTAAAATPTQPSTLSNLHASRVFHQSGAVRTYAFSSAEEAAAERRRRKRRLRIEPPLHALRRDNYPPPPRDPNAPRLPDSTSALVGPRLNLHNRVQSLIRAGDLDAASAVARHSVFSNTRPTVFTCNAIIASMYRAKRYNDAIALFQFFFNQSNIVPNVVSYNNLINTHCDMGNVDTALEVYRHILANAPFSPSSVTYRHLTKGLIDVGRIGDALDLLREMLNKGHGADSLVYNNLIAGYLNLGNLDKANELFDELKERCLVYDGVVNATFMDWFFNLGKDKEAMESYRSLLGKQFRMVPATCNTLIEVLLKHGKKTEAWALFDQMLDNHTPPNFQAVNSDTFNIMVNECFKDGKFEEAIATFRKVGTKAGSRPFSMDVAGYNNIITRYCEHGMLDEAENMFKELTSKSLCPDVPSHQTLIDAFLQADRIDDALSMLRRMVDAGLRVVASFGNRVFEELIKHGKAVDCAQFLTKMGEKDPKPDPTCYEVVVRGLCSEGALDVTQDLIGQIIRYGIGLTPSLKELVTEAFRNAGRGEEIERLLSMNRWGYAPRLPQQQGSAQIPRPPTRPQMAGVGVQSRMNGPAQYINMAAPVTASSFSDSQDHSQMNGHSSPMDGPHVASQVSGRYNGLQMNGFPSRMMNETDGPPQMSPPHVASQMSAPYVASQMNVPYSASQMNRPPSQLNAPSYVAPQTSMPYGPSQMNGHWGPSAPSAAYGGSQMNGSFATTQINQPYGAAQMNGPYDAPPMNRVNGAAEVNGVYSASQVARFSGAPQQFQSSETSQMSSGVKSSEIAGAPSPQWARSAVQSPQAACPSGASQTREQLSYIQQGSGTSGVSPVVEQDSQLMGEQYEFSRVARG